MSTGACGISNLGLETEPEEVSMKEKIEIQTDPNGKKTEQLQDKQESWIRQLSENFISSSGLHGLNKLQPGEISMVRRVLWTLMMLGSACYLGIIIVTELNNYYKYPTYTDIHVDHHKFMTFPAVTICNLSPYNRSKAPSDPRYFNYYLRTSESFHMHYQPVDWSDPHYFTYPYTTPLSKEEFMNRSMDLSKMFQHCSFDMSVGDCNVLIESVLTEFGPCFTFNKDGLITTNRTGAHYNALLKVFIDQANYFFGNSEGSGVKVIIHEPGEYLNMFHDGFVVPPGVYAYVAVTKKVDKQLPYPYKSYADTYCLDMDSSSYKNPNKYSNYSVNACLMECRIESARDKTPCVVPYLVDEEPYCSMRTMVLFIYYVGLTYKDEVTMAKCHEKCKRPCKLVSYDVTMSFANYPSDFTADLAEGFEPIPNTTMSEYYRKNFLFLNIFYTKMETTIWEQVAVYPSVGSVLANLGGQMGLFLGASLLTIIEIAEYFILIFVNALRRRRKKVGEDTNKTEWNIDKIN